MATIVAAAGGGNWTTGATWTGGFAPTAADDAQLGSGSGNVTIDAGGAVCRSLDCTGFTGTLTHASAATCTVGTSTAGTGNVALFFPTGMTYTLGSITSSAWSFISTSTTQQTIDTGGKTMGSITFNGVGGSWKLINHALVQNTSSSANVTLTNGTFNDGGENVTLNQFKSNNANTRVLTMSSTWTLSNTATPLDIGTSTGITINSTGSLIIISDTSSAAKTCQLDGGAFGKFQVNSSAVGSVKFNGFNFSMTGLSVTGPAAIILPSNSTLTMATAAGWQVNGTAGNVVTFTASTSGTSTSISIASGTISSDYLSLKDNHAVGGATFYAGANSTNVSGNSGWIFTAPPSKTRLGLLGVG